MIPKKLRGCMFSPDKVRREEFRISRDRGEMD
jgi:hypothetical protein